MKIQNKKSSVAFDAAPSNRWVDPATGYLHVKNNRLTRAQVDGYYGQEIMGSEAAGLEPERMYNVFRPWNELVRAAGAMNGIPLMDEHPEDDVNAETMAERKGELFPIGSVHNVRGEEPYLIGDLVVYDKDAIERIQSNEQAQLSCGYVYEPVAESGLYEGKPYDLKMGNIKFNHLALVPKGRVGPEVRVSDAKPKGGDMAQGRDGPKYNEAKKKVAEQEKLVAQLGKQLNDLKKAAADYEKVNSKYNQEKSLLEGLKDTLQRTPTTDEVPNNGVPPMPAKDQDDPTVEGEENGLIAMIAQGVKKFNELHEKEGYGMNPEMLDETPPPPVEAGTPVPGTPDEPAAVVKDDIEEEIALLEAKLAELKAKRGAEVADEDPAGTMPSVGGGAAKDESANSKEEVVGKGLDSRKLADEIARRIEEKYRSRDRALDEIRPLVGDVKFSAVANDAAAYTYALKAKGVTPPQGINVAGLRGMVQALITANESRITQSVRAADAAPADDEIGKLLASCKTRVY